MISSARPRSTRGCCTRKPTGLFDPPGLLFFDLDGVRLLLDRNAPTSLIYLHVDNVHETIERLDGLAEVISHPHVIFTPRGRPSRARRTRGVAGVHPRLRGQHRRPRGVPAGLTLRLIEGQAFRPRAARRGVAWGDERLRLGVRAVLHRSRTLELPHGRTHAGGPRLRRPACARTGCSTASTRVTCTLYGSLGATGIGHGTPDAVVAGLQGLDPEHGGSGCRRARRGPTGPMGARLLLDGTRPRPRFAKDDIAFAPRTRLPGHPNAMTLESRRRRRDDARRSPRRPTTRRRRIHPPRRRAAAGRSAHPFPLDFDNADELLAACDERGITIAEAARINEQALRSDERDRRGPRRDLGRHGRLHRGRPARRRACCPGC